MNLSTFESPDSKNLAGSSRVSGLKTLNTPEGAGAQAMPLYYLDEMLRRRVFLIKKIDAAAGRVEKSIGFFSRLP
jgi:galactitol-specific phosphotransferase system IIC component